MGAPNTMVVIDDCSGGLNLTDAPMALEKNQVVQAVNVEWVRSKFGRRRKGSSYVTSTFSSGGPFTTPIGTLYRHVPGTSEAAAEVWAVDSTPIFGRKAASTQFAAVAPVDAMTGQAYEMTWASVGGKLFVSYKSAVNRLHVWDGTTLRRTGLSPGSPNVLALVTDTGVGTYAAVARYYRVRFWDSIGGRVSEPTPSQAFTPSGGGLAARVPRPPLPGEGETYWIVEASADNATFYQIAQIAVATAIFDDTFLAASYRPDVFAVSPYSGTFNLQKSYRFIAGADNRLLGFGTFNTTAGVFQNRVEISDIVGGPTIGVLGVPLGSPAEIINASPQSGWYVDLDESDSGAAMGLKGPCFGNYYAFKTRQFWELRPTGDSTRPFAATAISKTIGTVSHDSICLGEDQQGRQAMYFWSHCGPYRYTTSGLEYIGRPIEGVFKEEQTFGDINLAAAIKVAHGVYYPNSRQVWWWVATSAYDEPNLLLIYHTLTGGWSQYLGLAPARCSALLPSTQGATMSRVLKPHYAASIPALNGRLIKADDETTGTDGGALPFTAELTTRPVLPGNAGWFGHIGDVQMVARGQGASILLQVMPGLSDYPPTRKSATVSLTPTSEEGTWVARSFDDTRLDEVLCAQYHLIDASAVAWVIDRLVIPVRPGAAATT